MKSLEINEPCEYLTNSSNIDGTIDVIIFKYSKHPSIMEINRNVDTFDFSFNDVQLNNIDREIKRLNTKTAPSPYGIPTKVLKEFSNVVCSKPLKCIINNGIENSIFKNELKLDNITPINKKNISNYRPLSVL